VRRKRIDIGLLLLVSLALAPAATPQSHDGAIHLQLKVIEGEGAVHLAGSRSSEPLTIQVSDEVGRPVAGVAVSFLMPGDGPAGIFANGLSTEILTTGRDGRASVEKIRWGHATGPVRIRITAMKSKARAGLVATQYVEARVETDDQTPQGPSHAVSKPRKKWIAIAVIAAGAAAGGLALGVSGSKPVNNSPAASAAATEPMDVQVGLPTITIGKP
jgi:hypothetical protein